MSTALFVLSNALRFRSQSEVEVWLQVGAECARAVVVFYSIISP